ncbi:uncharacterized protein LOC135828573 [Sycon ciliatum]|uniref:uncharacterized protein LOC135828573 n=1 Tax=Sycon ciliatum TaxID=27933 RepID=UPI0020AB8DC5|eukprot:scpid104010/ scgid31960/ Actin-depolymerizing factor 9
MASGVAVSDEVKAAWNDIKLGKKVRYYLLKLSDDLKEIIVEQKEADKSKGFDDFASMLKANFINNCRYAFFDLNFKNSEGIEKDKLVFFCWAPDSAKIKEKMLYASSKDALKKELSGVQVEYQATGPDELEVGDILAKCDR